MVEQQNSSEQLSASSSSSQPLKKMIPQLLLSVSIFSFVFSYSSLYNTSSSSSSTSSFKFHFFSANYFQLLSRALNKNCLFLICNGLLVFLAKTSGFIGPPSDYNNLNDVLQKKSGLDQYPKETFILDEKYVDDEPKEEDVEGDTEESERAKEVSIFIAESEEEGRVEKDIADDDDDESTAESRSFWLFDDEDQQQLYGQQVEEEQQEEEEDDDGEKVELSTQELNQKFEDFIRRMKEEIIINEARQKVVINI